MVDRADPPASDSIPDSAKFDRRTARLARGTMQGRSRIPLTPRFGFYLLAMLSLAASPVAGQETSDDSLFPTGGDEFEWEEERWPAPTRPISCRVRNFPPFLGFEFRFLTGYLAEIALREIRGPANRFLLRVAVNPVWPEAAEGVYFSRRFEVKEIAQDRRGAIQFSGSFAAGEGVYDVMWHLQDGFGRFCTARWTVEERPLEKGSRRCIDACSRQDRPLARLPVSRGNRDPPRPGR